MACERSVENRDNVVLSVGADHVVRNIISYFSRAMEFRNTKTVHDPNGILTIITIIIIIITIKACKRGVETIQAYIY